MVSAGCNLCELGSLFVNTMFGAGFPAAVGSYRMYADYTLLEGSGGIY